MKNRVFGLFVVLVVPTLALGQAKDASFIRTNPAFASAFKQVVAKSSECTVRVLCDGKETALGMIVDSDGWILTKLNDLKGKVSVKLKDGRSYEVKVTGAHKAHDLAMLKIEATGLPAVEFHDSKSATAGDWIACAGLSETPAAFGVVSVSTRDVAFKGPIFKGDVSKSGFLGVSVDVAEGGLKIIAVTAGTAAAKAELKLNDVILTLDGKNYLEPDSFIERMATYKPGDTITLKIRRGDEELELKPTLGARPKGGSRSDFQNKMGSELSSRRTGYPTILQHDSVIKPIDCGGPLVDLEGRVIGINICRAGRVESWAVPTEVIKANLKDLMTGKLPPPDLTVVDEGKTDGKEEKKEEPPKEPKKKGKKGKTPPDEEPTRGLELSRRWLDDVIIAAELRRSSLNSPQVSAA